MQMGTAHAIVQMVEAMLPRFTEGKLLHIALDVDYMCHPKQDDEDYTSIEKRFGIHYIFRRTSNYTMVLRCVKDNAFLIEDSDIFHMTSYHDSCWRSDGVESDLCEIDQKIMAEIEVEYEKIAGREMPRVEKLLQPNSVWIQHLKLLDGVVDGSGHDFRDYRVELKSGKINFIQIKD